MLMIYRTKSLNPLSIPSCYVLTGSLQFWHDYTTHQHIASDLLRAGLLIEVVINWMAVISRNCCRWRWRSDVHVGIRQWTVLRFFRTGPVRALYRDADSMLEYVRMRYGTVRRRASHRTNQSRWLSWEYSHWVRCRTAPHRPNQTLYLTMPHRDAMQRIGSDVKVL